MLRSNFRQLIRTTLGYSMNTLVGPIFTLLLTPLYTRALGVDNYGVIGVLTPLGMLIFLLGLLGLTSALPVLYYDPQRREQQQRIIASTLWVAAIWSAALGMCVFLGAAPLTRFAIGRLMRDDMPNLVRLMAIGLPFGVIYSIQTTVLRLQFAVWRANLLALLYILATAATNLLFVVLLGWGVMGVISAGVLTNVILGVAGLAVAPASLTMLPDATLMRLLVRTSLPLVPASLAIWVLTYGDRLFLPRSVAYQQIGLYDIANKLASALALLVEPFKSAWGPFALSIQQDPNAPRTYSKVLTYYCLVGLGLGLALSLFAHEALLILTTPQFIDAERYIWLLALTSLTSGFALITAIGLLIEKKLAQAAWIVTVAAALNTLLNFLLIAPWGVLGAAAATAIAYLASALLTAIRAQRVHPFPYEWRKVSIILAVYLALAGSGLAIGSRVELISIASRLSQLLDYPLVLRLLGVFELWELQLARRALAQPQMLLRWVLRRT
jgi:O-antigen/teichoic acid export membrane protein